MPFSNPIIGGNGTLVRQAMQSEGFTLDPESNVVGWRIERDGTAYFTGVTVGNTNYFVDENGNAAFNDVTVNGTLTIAGSSLSELLAPLPLGAQFWGYSTADSSATSGTTELGIMELDVTLTPGRMYRLSTNTLVVNGSVVGDVYRLGIRFALGESPSTSSNLAALSAATIDTANAARQVATINFVFACDDTAPDNVITFASGDVRFLLTLTRLSGTGTAFLTTGSGAWSPIVMTLEDIGPLIPNTAVANTGGGGTTPKKTVTKTYSATWSRSWDDSGGSVHSTNGELVQGQYDSSTGNRLSWIGFDYSTIQSDLSGATVDKVEVYLYYDHWYNFSGGTAVIGYHSSTATSAPAFDGSKDNQNEKQVSGWGINVGKWVDITDAGAFTASGWKDGTHTGIVLGPGPTTSHEYYGKARGNTESNEPKLRITYTK